MLGILIIKETKRRKRKKEAIHSSCASVGEEQGGEKEREAEKASLLKERSELQQGEDHQTDSSPKVGRVARKLRVSSATTVRPDTNFKEI